MGKRRKARIPVNDADRIEAEMAARNAQWYESIRHEPYDGVVGSLPTWVPEPIRKEFEEVRFKLFRRDVWERTPSVHPSVDDIRGMLDAHDGDFKGPFGPLLIPVGYGDYVARMARWRRIVALGAKLGAQELGVPDADVVEHGKKFSGRKQGAYSPETIYLARLVNKYRHEPADDLYRTLRAIADNPGDKKNPTPGECPFTTDKRSLSAKLLKRGKHYPLGTFRNAVTNIKRRIAAGEFTDT